MKKGKRKFGATIYSAIFAMMVSSGVITVEAVAQPSTAPSTIAVKIGSLLRITLDKL